MINVHWKCLDLSIVITIASLFKTRIEVDPLTVFQDSISLFGFDASVSRNKLDFCAMLINPPMISNGHTFNLNVVASASSVLAHVYFGDNLLLRDDFTSDDMKTVGFASCAESFAEWMIGFYKTLIDSARKAI